jgi:hypothetical protein
MIPEGTAREARELVDFSDENGYLSWSSNFLVAPAVLREVKAEPSPRNCGRLQIGVGGSFRRRPFHGSPLREPESRSGSLEYRG